MSHAHELEVAVDGGSVAVRCIGNGPLVVLIPSLGRSVDDFDALVGALAAAGFTAVLPEARGIGASTASLDGLTMSTLAADIAAVVRAVGGDGATAVVVGHAFGNRVARMVATDHPDVVDGVVLLACGGKVAPLPEVGAALLAVFDESLPDDEHLEAVRLGFFADGNDPAVWTGGWYPAVAMAQGAANRARPAEHWWTAGTAPALVVQPAEDRIAPSANADDIMRLLGDRATLVTIVGAGHALLPEQPAAVADAVIGWLQRRS